MTAPPGGSPAGAGGADSAGVPWAGRTLTPQPFAGDRGEADPALARALAWASGSRPAGADRPGAGEEACEDAAVGAAEDVAAALAAARLLVPVVAVGGEVTATHGDANADMAMPTLTLADGARALPVFSGQASLTAWDGAARPVPAGARRVALAAVAEGCTELLVDPAGPHPYRLRRPMLWALAQGRPWVAPARDPEVAAVVEAACVDLPDVRGTRCEPQGVTGLRVVLGVRAGLGPQALEGLVTAVRGRLTGSELLAERAEALQLAVLPA